MPSSWVSATARTPGELAYQEWSGGVAATQAGWWAWVVASSDWATVCAAVAAYRVSPKALCAMRLEFLEACRIHLSGTPQARVISSWISAHLGWPRVVPGVAAVLDSGACPDCTVALMCIDPRPPLAAAPPTGPMQHLLRKAFPRRCQIRELLRFVSAYWSKFPEVEWFLRCAVFCSLGGFYKHHNESSAPPLAARQALYDVCFLDGSMSLAAWMRTPESGSALHSMQCTLLVVLQDAVVSTVHATPLQAAAYHGFVDWPLFIGHVSTAASAAQRVFAETRLLHAPVKRGEKRARGQQPHSQATIFAQLGDEGCLAAWLTTNVIRDEAVWDDVIRASGALLPRQGIVANTRKNGWGRASCLYDFLRKVRRRGGEICVPLERWACHGFGTHAARHDALVVLGQSNPRALPILAVLVEVMRARRKVVISPLSCAVEQKQRAAVRVRYASCEQHPAHAGALVVCLFCAAVKNPVVKNHIGGPAADWVTSSRHQLSSGVGAGGVVYDDETCRIYCNAHTRTGGGRRVSGGASLLRSRLCALTPLWVGSVVGQVATIGDELFVLCCECACPMKLSKPKEGGSFLLCEACAHNPGLVCVCCGKGPGTGRPRAPQNWSTVVRLVYGGKHIGPGNLRLGPLCGPCGRSVECKRRRCFESTHIICV